MEPSRYSFSTHNYRREYLIEPLDVAGETPGVVYTYHDTLKDALLNAIDIVDHWHTTGVIEKVRVHHRGFIVAEFQVFRRTSHYVGTPDGWVARYEPGSTERERKAKYSSRLVITANPDAER